LRLIFFFLIKQAEVERKSGRTGWPPEVWATELKKNFNNSNEPNINSSNSKSMKNYSNKQVINSPSSNLNRINTNYYSNAISST
jgi:hypothetical protein